MPTVLLPMLPGTLPANACYTSEQQRLIAFAENLQAQLESGQSFYNFGDSKPAAEFNAYPWLRSTDMRWYYYNGGWVSPHEEQSIDARRLWVGNLTDLKTYDGGDAGAPSDRSGPMWEEDIEFRGRSPMGPGTTPGGTVISPAVNAGNDKVTLTAANVPIPDHRHHVAANVDSAADITATTQMSSSGNTGQTEEEYQLGGTSTDASLGQTSLPIGPPPAITDVDILNPVRGCYVIKRTNRLFRFIA